MDTRSYLGANVERFMGFAECYDRYRPQPPIAILDLLTQLAGIPRPELVVDLGSGTGLSTAIWSSRAKRVFGIEPSRDMLDQAEARLKRLPDAGNVSFFNGYSHQTGLADGCAEIVTCSQSLHWMEPESTFAEVARILRPGGVFAAYDCAWPPTVHWEADQAFRQCMERASGLFEKHRISRDLRAWGKRGHLDRMRESGRFRFLSEIAFHHVEEGDAERLVGVARSQGTVASLLKHGLSEAEIGIEALRAEARRTIGDAPRPWHWSYHACVGVV